MLTSDFSAPPPSLFVVGLDTSDVNNVNLGHFRLHFIFVL